MISLPRFLRLTQSREFGLMLDETLRSGRPLPLSVRLALADERALPATAIGLALRRVVELTYKPVRATAELCSALLDEQRADGSFGTLVGTAVGAAALASVDRQVRSLAGFSHGLEGMDESLIQRIHSATHAAAGALRAMTATAAEGRRGLREHQSVEIAIVLWQCTDLPGLASLISAGGLWEAAESAGMLHDRSAASLLDPLAPRPVPFRSTPNHGRPSPIGRRSTAA